MCTEDSIRVIDPEFATYGPMGFDLGMMLANLVMAYISQPAHRKPEDLSSYQGWILTVMKDLVAAFQEEFSKLWHSERQGVLFPKSLFEDQEQAASIPLQAKQRAIWEDALGFCGIEMHRRTLSLAHNADFESIEDSIFRGKLEAQNLLTGSRLILERPYIADCNAFLSIIQSTKEEDQ